MNRKSAEIEWFVPATVEIFDEEGRRYRRMSVSVLLAVMPLIALLWWPIHAWMALVNGPHVATRIAVVVTVLALLQPLLLWLLAVLTERRGRRPGRKFGWTYRLEDRAVRWGDKLRSWKRQRAFAIERDRSGVPVSMTLLSVCGRTTHIAFPADAPLAERAIAYVLARDVPLYRADVHGPLDLAAEVPPAFTWVLVSIGIVIVASLGAFESMRPFASRDAPRAAYLLVVAASALGPIIWYAVVRPHLNVIQRDRAVALAIGGGLTILAVGLCILGVRPMLAVFEELKQIPPDVRERISRTVSSPKQSGDD